MKKLRIIALITLLSLALCACGSEKTDASVPVTEAAPTEAPVLTPLTLNDWTMSASTWSSPNGATVHIAATPSRYAEGHSAAFLVRLGDEEVANVPCQWNGTQYTADADLNAANGYSYYLMLTDPRGIITEVSVNTPSDPSYETLINMEDSLNSHCDITVDESSVTDTELVLNSGRIQVQAPKIGNDGQTITCVDVWLVLNLDEEEIDKKVLVMQGTDDIGYYTLELSDISFKLPQMESGQELALDLEVRLSNDQVLTASGGNWYYLEEGLTAAG